MGNVLIDKNLIINSIKESVLARRDHSSVFNMLREGNKSWLKFFKIKVNENKHILRSFRQGKLELLLIPSFTNPTSMPVIVTIKRVMQKWNSYIEAIDSELIY